MTGQTQQKALARRFLKSFWQLVAGALCIAAGGAAIYLGWYGASHTRDVTDQIPYGISGGLLGVALIVLGSAFYFSFFISRLYSATKRQASVLERAIERLENLAPAASVSRIDPSEAIVVAAGAKRFHRPGCTLVTGKDAGSLSFAEAERRGLKPCKVCEPAA